MNLASLFRRRSRTVRDRIRRFLRHAPLEELAATDFGQLAGASPWELIDYAAIYAAAGKADLALRAYDSATRMDGHAYETRRYLGLTALLASFRPEVSERYASDLDACDHLRSHAGAFEATMLANAGSICVVGNSPCEIGKGRGREIDTHALVIRFNNFSVAPQHAVDYGSKTDIWARTPRFDTVPTRPGFRPLLTVCPVPLTWRVRNAHELVSKWAAEQMPLCECTDPIVGELAAECGAPASSGLTLLGWIAKILGGLERATVVGFSLDEQVSGLKHYFQNVPRKNPPPHNWARERQILSRLIHHPVCETSPRKSRLR